MFAYVGDAPDCQIALWQASFALGTDNCIGHTMSSKAQEIGVTTACISKGSTKICRMLGLSPSPWMLDEDSRRSYRDLRRTQEERRIIYNQSGHPVTDHKIVSQWKNTARGTRGFRHTAEP